VQVFSTQGIHLLHPDMLKTQSANENAADIKISSDPQKRSSQDQLVDAAKTWMQACQF
jgi:hypothetical protein